MNWFNNRWDTTGSDGLGAAPNSTPNPNNSGAPNDNSQSLSAATAFLGAFLGAYGSRQNTRRRNRENIEAGFGPNTQTPNYPPQNREGSSMSPPALRSPRKRNATITHKWEMGWEGNGWDIAQAFEKKTRQSEEEKGVIYLNEQAKDDVDQARKDDTEFDELVKRLEQSDELYAFQFVKKGEADPLKGGFHTDGHKLIIGYTTGKSGFGLGKLSALFHETEHARQFEDGEIGFRFTSSGWSADRTYDIIDEAKAWMFSFNAKGSDKTYKAIHFGNMDKALEKLQKMLKQFPKDFPEYDFAFENWKIAGRSMDGVNYWDFKGEGLPALKTETQYHRFKKLPKK